MAKSAQRDEIVRFCSDLLKVKDFSDSCANGLQVEGAGEVRKIVTGVSLSKRLIREAISRHADMIMVHHGLFQNEFPQPTVIRGHSRDRLALLLSHNISLCGFHLPLDAAERIGNNASICKLLGVRRLEALSVGFIGTLSPALPFKEFVAKVDRLLSTRSYTIRGTTPKAKRVAIISGGASNYFQKAIDAGADTFLTGSINEWEVRPIEENGLNFIHAGHYNTERHGIRNLGELVGKKFKIPVEYVEIPCDV